MIKKQCFCKKTEKNFKFDIGPGFFAQCCAEAGFNKLGELIEVTTKAESEEVILEDAESLTNEQADSKKEINIDKMSRKELMLLCDNKDLKYKGNISNKDLRELAKS